MTQGSIDYGNFQHRIINKNKKYDTGWINRSDWTNVHMGSNTTLNVDSDVDHNFDKDLSDLEVVVLVSTDGTDDNSFTVTNGGFGAFGYSVYQINTNSVRVQTSVNGMQYIDDTTGNNTTIAAQNWYYKIVVWKKR